MVRDNFAIFILSHGRANNVKTVDMLKRINYTGKWYIIVDNEDNQYEDYCKNFGEDKIIVFNDVRDAYPYIETLSSKKEVYALFENDLPDTYNEK